MGGRTGALALAVPGLVALGLLVAATVGDRAPVPAVAAEQVPPAAPAREPGVVPPLETPFTVAPGVVRRTLSFGPDGLAQTLDVFSAASAPRPRPTVLLVHGGGWQIGDSTEWAAQAVELVTSRGWTAVSLNYRLAPQHVWPAAFDDAVSALRLLHDRAAELGVDVTRVGAVGDSAGAQLAALLGEPAPDRPSVRSVVTWSGVNDLAGLLQQRSAGGCPDQQRCEQAGLALKVVRDLMGCEPQDCPEEYRAASPAAAATSGHAATLAISSEGEQVDPRQAWVMDSALSRSGVPSRVEVLPGRLHARGFQSAAWPATLRFLEATLTPETAPAYPRPAVETTLEMTADGRTGLPLRLNGAVRPRALGSSVALQVQEPDASWRTVRTAPLRVSPVGTTYDLTWTPQTPGTTVWRAVWRGGGGEHATAPRTVVVR